MHLISLAEGSHLGWGDVKHCTYTNILHYIYSKYMYILVVCIGPDKEILWA